jgi:hypothetical protein
MKWCTGISNQKILVCKQESAAVKVIDFGLPVVFNPSAVYFPLSIRHFPSLVIANNVILLTVWSWSSCTRWELRSLFLLVLVYLFFPKLHTFFILGISHFKNKKNVWEQHVTFGVVGGSNMVKISE